ncbi:MAG: sulfatase-like hydrolase/transferase [Oscillospiraceae bacterium]
MSPETEHKKRDNIILVAAGGLRADALAHLGNPAAVTPHLDELAQEGISFSNAYCQSTEAAPSCISLLSGLYPHSAGHRTATSLQRPDEPNILKAMKDNGYEVIWIGMNDFLPPNVSKTPYCHEYHSGSAPLTSPPQYTPAQQMQPVPPYSFYGGQQDSESAPNSYDWNCLQAALAFIKEKSEMPGESPFFLYLSLRGASPPYICEDPWYSSIDQSLLPSRRPNIESLSDKAAVLDDIREKQNLMEWGDPQFDELRATYLARVSRLDSQIGELCAELKGCNLFEDTNLLITSPYGDYAGDYGLVEKADNCFEDPLCRVPLIVKPAERHICSARITPALSELIDIPATLADMAGFSLGYIQHGLSLLPAVAGSDAYRGTAFCEGGRLKGEALPPVCPVHSPYWPRFSAQASENGQNNKACMIRVGNLKYIMRMDDKEELYDLEADPGEIKNLIQDASYSLDLLELRGHLLYFMVQTSGFISPLI